MKYQIIQIEDRYAVARADTETPVDDARFDTQAEAEAHMTALMDKEPPASEEAESKSVDLEAELAKIREAFYALYPNQFNGPGELWIYSVLDDALILKTNGQKYRVPYTKTDAGITFAPRVDWQPGEMVQEFVPSDMAPDALEVKALPDGRIRAYALVWGDESNTDLSEQKDYFTPRTDFWDKQLPMPRPLTYHHGWNAETKAMPVVGRIDEFGDDDVGRWYIAELDKAHRYEKAVRALIAQRALRSSVDSIPQYARREAKANGAHEIQVYPLFGVTLTPMPAEPRLVDRPAQEMKSLYQQIGVELKLPEAAPEASNRGAAARRDNATSHSANTNVRTEAKSMNEQELIALLEKREAEKEAKAKAEQEAKAAQDAIVAARVQDEMNKLAKARGIPLFPAEQKSNVSVASKYDVMKLPDLAFLAMIRGEAKAIGKSAGVDGELARALALKSVQAVEQGKLEAKAVEDLFPTLAVEAKANEVMQSTLASYGDEWVPTNYSTQLWLAVRAQARLLRDGFISEQEIPKGYESDTIPLEGTDFTFYNVGQAASEDSTMKTVPATVTSSKEGSNKRVVTVGKLGARGYISGELDEDSIIDMIPEARRKLEAQLPPELDFVLFNGDDTAATDNINGAGTPTTGADYTVFQGIIRNALKNASGANASDASAALTSAKIRTLYGLLGTDGYMVWDNPELCRVFCDYQTWGKLEGLSDLLTVANAGDRFATIAVGADPNKGIPVHGVNWLPSAGVRKAQATGIRHGTESSNTLGRAVLVRGDQWKIRWKRRAKFETTRVAYADLTEIVVTLRLGIGYYDTESSAILYNI